MTRSKVKVPATCRVPSWRTSATAQTHQRERTDREDRDW